MEENKKKGRPRKFDVEMALNKAINVFWKKGYHGASLTDLTKEMGINGPSLYSAFGSKHDLYLQSIEAYINKDNCLPIIAFEEEADIKLAVKAFFKEIIKDTFENSQGVSGCFLSSCVATSAEECTDVKSILKETVKAAEKRLTERFEKEKQLGGLPEHFPSLKRAKLLFDLRQGIAFRARAGLSKKEISESLDSLVELVLS